MASPTHETMDLAGALLEEDSSPSLNDYNGINSHEEDRDGPYNAAFRGLVVTKDSSTELIPTQQVELTVAYENKPRYMRDMIRDLNSRKSMLTDDGRPIVRKVFSRVIQISPNENKPKQLKARRGPSKKEECCPSAGCVNSREKASIERPQSSVTKPEQQLTSGPATISNVCPACMRQFSDETMRHHMVFCNGSSKEIM